MADIRSFEPLWDQWTIEEKLGVGRYGNIYCAARRENDEVYYAALKHISIPAVWNEDCTGDEQNIREYYERILEELLSEIHLMHQLRGYANIVAYEDHQVIPKQDGVGYDVFIRMELLRSLSEIAQETSFTPYEACQLGIDVCTALETLAKWNIIHKNIKPEKIFRNNSGDYKLGVLGVTAKPEHAANAINAKSAYAYMAPEVFQGQAADSLADIYSLGLVIHRLLDINDALQMPDHMETEAAMMRRMAGEPLPKPFFADEALNCILATACAPNPAARYRTPTAFKQALQTYLENVPCSLPKEANEFRTYANPSAFPAEAGFALRDNAPLDSEVPQRESELQRKSVAPTQEQRMCQQCGASLKSNAVFCPKCGTPCASAAVQQLETEAQRTSQPLVTPRESEQSTQQQRICPRCGASLKSDAAFCSKCGTLWVPMAPQQPEPKAQKGQPPALPEDPGQSTVKLEEGVCQRCGKVVIGKAVFCSECGTPYVAPPTQHPAMDADSKKAKKSVVWIVAILAVLLSVAILVFAIKFLQENDSLPGKGELTTSGQSAVEDDLGTGDVGQGSMPDIQTETIASDPTPEATAKPAATSTPRPVPGAFTAVTDGTYHLYTSDFGSMLAAGVGSDGFHLEPAGDGQQPAFAITAATDEGTYNIANATVAVGASFSEGAPQLARTYGSTWAFVLVSGRVYYICLADDPSYVLGYSSGTLAIESYDPDLDTQQWILSPAAVGSVSDSGDPLAAFIITLDDSYITLEDIYGFDEETMGYIRNGIYALSGKIFRTEKYQEYFGSQSWYMPYNEDGNVIESLFNEYQTRNLNVCLDYEKMMGWR